MIDPLLILGISLFVIFGMILVLRTGAFLALITAAFVVSFLAGGEPGPDLWLSKVTRVTQEFGVMAGNIGLLIAMGAIIGKCMMQSGAADKIVFSIMRLLGEKRVPVSLFSAGFIISIPVFYDTTLYLLIPLARTFYKNVRKNYLLLIIAIAAGATLTHNLVPPTPGPLIAATNLKVPLGAVMFTGTLVALILAPITFLACIVVNRFMPNPTIGEAFSFRRDEPDALDSPKQAPGQTNFPEQTGFPGQTNSPGQTGLELPSFIASIAPIIAPVMLITAGSIWKMLESANKINGFGLDPENHFAYVLRNLVLCLGNPNIALILGAAIAAAVMKRQKKMSLKQFAIPLESAVLDAGLIILITAAGGAFGAMLRTAKIGEYISVLLETESGGVSGVGILLLAFGLTSMIKIAQGSSTMAIITGANIVGPIIAVIGADKLGFHPAYVATTIGLGGMVTAWMNDSGFWVFCRMGGINEIDALKTWSLVLAFMGCTGLGIVLVLVKVLPLV